MSSQKVIIFGQQKLVSAFEPAGFRDLNRNVLWLLSNNLESFPP